ncbi:MAG: hypothetical protein JXJ19_08920 [Elusimicrobia bacterium]|nr:hypothetical protein [Elusimicrobiota bacterium]
MEDSELRKLAIVDANINRVSEGLRVIEDWSRFYLRDEDITGRLRAVRHELWETVGKSYGDVIRGRSTGEDILAGAAEKKRAEAPDIPKASFNRVKEGVRVLEEMGKLLPGDAAKKFKDMRFRIYDLEREFYEKCT